MNHYKTVSILIQARSTSTRFPGKIFEKIGHKSILDHVLDACYNSASYINKYTSKNGIVCGVAIVAPYDDILIKKYSKHLIIEGPEDDVLSRFVIAADKLLSDYVVRITADCPFIPPYAISKMIGISVNDNLDYLTNADPVHRTSPDGHDIQILSKDALKWLHENSKESIHREHVCTYLEKTQNNLKTANIIGFADYSNLKFSVDTKEDLNNLSSMYTKIYQSVNAKRSYRL